VIAHEGQRLPGESGSPCYGDGTVLGAQELCDRWRAADKDEGVIWCALEERYSRWA
jgi:hypothetical protein